MARREAVITIARPGRDQGKTFLLTEMPSVQAEEWFNRAVMLLARSGTEVPSDIFMHGSMAFAALGIGAVLTGLGKAPFPEVKSLLAEMMTCVSIRTPAGPVVTMISQVLSQIEEVATIIQLREEVLSLHLGFSLAARLSDLKRAAAASMEAVDMRNTLTSDPSSAPSSPPESPAS
jgi:hypothetical protein